MVPMSTGVPDQPRIPKTIAIGAMLGSIATTASPIERSATIITSVMTTKAMARLSQKPSKMSIWAWASSGVMPVSVMATSGTRSCSS